MSSRAKQPRVDLHYRDPRQHVELKMAFEQRLSPADQPQTLDEGSSEELIASICKHMLDHFGRYSSQGVALHVLTDNGTFLETRIKPEMKKNPNLGFISIVEIRELC